MSQPYESVAIGGSPIESDRRSGPRTALDRLATGNGYSSSLGFPSHRSNGGPLALFTSLPAALRAMPRRTLVRISVIIACGMAIIFVFASSGSSEQRSAGTNPVSSGVNAAYGYGDSKGLMRFWDLGRDRGSVGNAAGKDTGTGADFVDLEQELPLTRFDGGFTVFSNLYLSYGAFLHVSDPHAVSPEGEGPTPLQAGHTTATKGGPPLPFVRQIMSGPRTDGGFPAAEEDRWKVVHEDVARDELGSRAVYLSGVTYIFNDGPGEEGYLVYFRHFCIEAFLGATRALAHVLQHYGHLSGADAEVPLPKRVWFPRCGWNPSWRDAAGQNAWFLQHALPGVQIEDANGFHDRAQGGLPVILEKAVIVDRWAAHSISSEASAWGKMNADVAALPAPRGFWNGIRRNVMRSLGVDGVSKAGTGKRGLPVVVYIDGQTSESRLAEHSHSALINALKGLTDVAEVHVSKLGAMKRPQQVDLMGRADIVIAAHSDALLDVLWMPPGERSAVVELFEENGFDRNFQLLAASLGHRYVAIQKDKAMTEPEWRVHGNNRGENASGAIEVDADLVARTVRDILVGSTDEGE